jgi:hypothetical protein
MLEGPVIIESTKVQRLEPPPESALAYLQSRYRDPFEDPIIRRRCAIACLPFESPKLQALAVHHAEGGLGQRLDAARKRRDELEEARAEGRVDEFIRPKVIEGEATRVKGF